MTTCEQVIQELAAPTTDRDPAAIDAHLAGCPLCASWAEQAAAFDRLWEATRPVEPSDATWDHLWAGVSDRLDALEPVAPLRLADAPASPWRSRERLVLGLAQAAALLLAATALLRTAPSGDHGPGPSPTVPALASSAPVPTEFDIEPGQRAMIHYDDGRVRLERAKIGPLAGAGELDDNLVVFAAFELMASEGAFQ